MTMTLVSRNSVALWVDLAVEDGCEVGGMDWFQAGTRVLRFRPFAVADLEVSEATEVVVAR